MSAPHPTTTRPLRPLTVPLLAVLAAAGPATGTVEPRLVPVVLLSMVAVTLHPRPATVVAAVAGGLTALIAVAARAWLLPATDAGAALVLAATLVLAGAVAVLVHDRAAAWIAPAGAAVVLGVPGALAGPLPPTSTWAQVAFAAGWGAASGAVVVAGGIVVEALRRRRPEGDRRATRPARTTVLLLTSGVVWIAAPAPPAVADHGSRTIEAEADLRGEVRELREVAAGEVVASTERPAEAAARMPIAARLRASVDGQPHDPADLDVVDGDVSVHVEIRNTSGRSGRPGQRPAGDAVPLPLVATVTARFGDAWHDLHAPSGVVTAQRDGTTTVRWTAPLFAPVGADRIEVRVDGRADAAAAPDVVVEASPVAAADAGPLGHRVQDLEDRWTDVGVLALTVGSVADGLDELADGLGELHAGLDELAAGSTELAAGLDEAAAGADELHAGAEAVATGTEELAAEVSELPSPDELPLDELQAALRRLEDVLPGSDDLDDAPALPDGAEPFGPRLDEVRDHLEDLIALLQRLADGDDPTARVGELAAGARQVADGVAELAVGLAELRDGGQALAEGAGEAADAARRLDDGAADLLDGAALGAEGGEDLAGLRARDRARLTAMERRAGAEQAGPAAGPAPAGYRLVLTTPAREGAEPLLAGAAAMLVLAALLPAWVGRRVRGTRTPTWSASGGRSSN